MQFDLPLLGHIGWTGTLVPRRVADLVHHYLCLPLDAPEPPGPPQAGKLTLLPLTGAANRDAFTQKIKAVITTLCIFLVQMCHVVELHVMEKTRQAVHCTIEKKGEEGTGLHGHALVEPRMMA